MPSAPSQTLRLDLTSERDHIRGSGGVAAETGDIDGDGKLDLLLTHVAGSFTASTISTRVYLNRDGRWNLDRPDRSYENKGAVGSDSLMDLDGDGFPELLRATIEMNLLELVEVLLTRELDVRVEIFRGANGKPGKVFDRKAIAAFKIDIPLNFESFRPAGFLATVKTDLNNDGYRDLIRSGEGDEISVYLGDATSTFKRRAARQKVDSRGVMNLGDWNGDGLPDLLLFDPKIPEVPLRLLINRGTLSPR